MVSQSWLVGRNRLSIVNVHPWNPLAWLLISRLPIRFASVFVGTSLDNVFTRPVPPSPPFQITSTTFPNSGNVFFLTVLILTFWWLETGLSSGMPSTTHHLGGLLSLPSLFRIFIHLICPSGISITPSDLWCHEFSVYSSTLPRSVISAFTPNEFRA